MISYRKITISTCGLVPGIKRLSELKLPVKLAVSLVSAEDPIRSRIMKVNHSFPLSELKKALISFQRHQEKRITLEYCLLSGVNTTKESAEALGKFTRGLECLVNLIPWNPIDELEFKTPSEREIQSFTKELKMVFSANNVGSVIIRAFLPSFVFLCGFVPYCPFSFEFMDIIPFFGLLHAWGGGI